MEGTRLRILQTADNHLGETAYSRIDSSTGLNARGLDFLNSFKNILSLTSKEQADVLLVVGDFFTRVNPHPRYLLEVMKGLRRLSKAGVTTIVVSGNHETPKMLTTVNPLSLLGEIDNVYVVLEPTCIEVNDVDFVCVPAPPVFDEIKSLFEPLLQKALVRSTSSLKILAAHIPLAQAIVSSERTLESFIGDYVDVRQIPSRFVYAALGHMHRFQQLGQGSMPIVYSGSSERCEWGEERDDKFVVLIEVEEEAEIKPLRLPVRKMETVIDLNCSGLSAARINKKVLAGIESSRDKIRDALVRIKLDNVDIDEYRLIDWSVIKQVLGEYGAFEFKFQPHTVISLPGQPTSTGEYIFPPSKELELYVKNKKEYKGIQSELLRLGNQILDEARGLM